MYSGPNRWDPSPRRRRPIVRHIRIRVIQPSARHSGSHWWNRSLCSNSEGIGVTFGGDTTGVGSRDLRGLKFQARTHTAPHRLGPHRTSLSCGGPHPPRNIIFKACTAPHRTAPHCTYCPSSPHRPAMIGPLRPALVPCKINYFLISKIGH